MRKSPVPLEDLYGGELRQLQAASSRPSSAMSSGNKRFADEDEDDEDLDDVDVSDEEFKASDDKRRDQPRTGDKDDEEEEEEDEEESSDEEAGGGTALFDLCAVDEAVVAERVKLTQSRMRDLLSDFTPEQMQRYELFRRVGLSRPAIKRLICEVYAPKTPATTASPPIATAGGGKKRGRQAAVSGPASINVPPNAIIAVAGVAKVFVGELVETARALMTRAGHAATEPLTPFFLSQAWERLRASGLLFEA